ncbi:MAG: DUF3025 domain-containing protein [Psychrobacter sp.]|uniref:DUF3025 domain-containing protein n=1 Tax=unclassified Psychrobacter TaxID=196806 RepID=UPI001787E8B0|nr:MULTISPECIES: DUF3025 domain-containing protein [unclassified Psychrobacter]MBE0442192.1 DUF3025 domain-containing protein [Psychrobacter sp. FME13]
MPTNDLPVILDSDVRVESATVLDKDFAEIDWQSPWMCHLNQLSSISETIQNLSTIAAPKNEIAGAVIEEPLIDVIADILNTAINRQRKETQGFLPTTKPTEDNQVQALKFVSQDALPEGEAYESFIATTGNIPTRDNLHDLFNGSIWLTFPKTKALLNYYHMLEIAAQGVSERRGRVRDTITVFDENGAVLVTVDPNIGEALIDFNWQASLVVPRAQWDNPKQPSSSAQAAVYIFGHALLEQLIHPRKPLCAHSIVIHVSQAFFALSLAERMSRLDNKVAEYMNTLLSNDDVKPQQLAPLPILGVPHFWSDNIDPRFYDDNYVFRSGRRKKIMNAK